jgi:hypothetical protein
MSTLARTNDAPIFFSKRCTLHRKSSGGICGPPMMQFVSLEKGKAKSWSFRKNLKLIDEEPTWVLPNEIEKLVAELQRDRALFKRISDEDPIASPAITAASPLEFTAEGLLRERHAFDTCVEDD